MSNRLRSIATENELIAEQGTYRNATATTVEIADLLDAARAGTVSYPPDHTITPTGGLRGSVEVTAEDSIQAALRLTEDGAEHVAVLNFASARNPGGGYVRGAAAQEEDLCRSALLYRCLLEAPDYYAAHRASTDLRYSHRVIWSPHVPVIRDGRRELLEQPWTASFLTSAAPNASQLAMRSETGPAGPPEPAELAELLAERAQRVLAVAAQHGARELVLGAWGCGVFRNDPETVAAAFERALALHGAAFTRVVFAVWDRSPRSANRAAFEHRFGGARSRSATVQP
ncbi:TIGR02452 family protein [Kitasatospora azatica]|uniref:TIGR02452 family protein n=1 Tax=Kitasatospora azatica TaxID=58347 RepID=UPI00056A8665|nr:TIGR02452 family protein [Kitasatospora azatica]